jgi:hypothetical protein
MENANEAFSRLAASANGLRWRAETAKGRSGGRWLREVYLRHRPEFEESREFLRLLDH